MTDPTPDQLGASLAEILSEATDGGPGEYAWFSDGRSTGGIEKTLARIPASHAFERSQLTPGHAPAEHAAHLLYAIDLFERALRGDDAYAGADWEASWTVPPGIPRDEAGWATLRGSLIGRLRDAADAVLSRDDWSDRFVRTGTIGNIAHLTYHLGQLRLIAAACERAG